MGKTTKFLKNEVVSFCKCSREGFLLIETMVCLAAFIVTALLVGYAMAHMYSALQGYTIHAKILDYALANSDNYIAHGEASSHQRDNQFLVTAQPVAVTQQPYITQSPYEVILEPLEFLKVSVASKVQQETHKVSLYALALKSGESA